MSLSDLASLGSFVSGVAVLASLVFLFFQMRQMTEQVRQAEKNQQAIIKQGRTSRLMDINARLTDASFAEVTMKIRTNAQDMTQLDIARVAAHARSIFFNNEESFSQYRRGLLDEDDFKAFVMSLRWGLRSPHTRVEWKRHRELFTADFVQFVDKIMDETPVVLRPYSVAEWQADMVAEMAKAA